MKISILWPVASPNGSDEDDGSAETVDAKTDAWFRC
jgi:hypothetical protein